MSLSFPYYQMIYVTLYPLWWRRSRARVSQRWSASGCARQRRQRGAEPSPRPSDPDYSPSESRLNLEISRNGLIDLIPEGDPARP